MSIPIIDSHIHLFPGSHLPTLAWHGPENPLGSQHCMDEYRAAALRPAGSSVYFLRGFIFIETDRLSTVDPAENAPSISTTEDNNRGGWTHVLDEISLLTRIIQGLPLPGEGHANSQTDRSLCLGIVPWAPVPGGPKLLARYMALVKERTKTEEIWKKIRGVRYLFQDKERGTMLKDKTIAGLNWLGRNGLVFDLGVDARQGGLWQLREAVEMMKMVHNYGDGGTKKDEAVTIIINHLCKPNLRLPGTSSESVTSHPEFLEWKSSITAMAQFPTTYMKLSGGFSELPPLSTVTELDISLLVKRLQPWTDAVFDAFGTERVMFGSDWPVCNVGGGGNGVSWQRWRAVVKGMLDERGLNREQMKGVWGEVAVKAYGIDV